MAKKRPPRITARVTLEGPAEDVLMDVQRLRACERRVNLTIEVGRPYYTVPDYFVPEIRGGQIQAALETLQNLSHQVLDDESVRRLERLIREFGRFTA